MAERIRKACGEQFGHLAALLVGEACVLAVGLGVLEVNFLMRDIHIAAHDDRLLRIQLYQILAEGILPRHAVIQALEFILRVGRIHGNEVEFAVIGGDDTALVVVLLNAKTIGDALRLGFGEQRHAGVSLLLCRVPVFAVAALERHISLSRLHLGLLQAQHIRLFGGDKIKETLAHARTQTVYIP